MSALLASIARSLARHWIRGLIALVVGILVVGAIAGSQNGSAPEDFSIPGAESQKAFDLLEERFPAQSGAQAQIVFTTADGSLESAPRQEAITSTLAKIAELPHVSSTVEQMEPMLSEDGRTGLSTVTYDISGVDIEQEDGERLIDTAETAETDGITVEMRGEVVDWASQSDFPLGELIGIGIAIVLLTILFRSFAAMITTLVGALVGVMISQMILAAVAKPIGIPEFANTIAVMLGLGAGIDYALLIVGRYREQVVANGGDTPDAAAKANATSGVSVVAAGTIVMIAIAGLLAVGIPLVGKMGLGSAIAIAAVVVSSITVLPIFMGMLKRWLRPRDPAHVARSERFERWGRLLTRRPAVAVAVGGLLLVLFAIPMTDMRLGQPDDGNQPTSLTQRQAYDQIASAFGAGFSGPLLLAIENRDGAQLQPAELDKLKASLEGASGIDSVADPEVNDAGDTATLVAIPTTSPQNEATADLVERLRERDLPAAVDGTQLNVYVGGQVAAFIDFSDKIASRLPLFIGIVIGLSILLLMAVFRSIWVPLASAVFNLLSIGAAYGVVVAVFQWGWGASLIGAGDDVPIISFVPLFMFAILFGLSMDYNVFLLSRIREAYFEGDSPKESVVHGLSRIAKVILAAGLIMASVFLAFVTGSDTIIKMFGLGLGAAILIDVLIVRMVVSPALMALLGDRAWWFPRWLDRILPDISLEGHHDSRAERVAERESEKVPA